MLIVKFTEDDFRRATLAKQLWAIAAHDVDGTGERPEVRVSPYDYDIIVDAEWWFAREQEAQHE